MSLPTYTFTTNENKRNSYKLCSGKTLFIFLLLFTFFGRYARYLHTYNIRNRQRRTLKVSQ